MHDAARLTWILAACIPSLVWGAQPTGTQSTGARAAVATVHPLATDAALNALQSGGNAVDAGVAAALTLGVVDGHNSGIGGGCFILIRNADGTLAAIDGRETAPAKAHRDMYLRDSRFESQASRTGPLASGTPGALAAYDLAIRKYGRLTLKQLLLPAARIAENGFPLDRIYAQRLQATAGTLGRFPASTAVLLKPDGSPYREGEQLRQPDLARTYRSVADNGIRWFYRGPFAELCGDWMADNGGILTAEDFRGYAPRERTPVVATYRGLTIVGFPPPSSGGVHVAQILNILERFDLKRLYATDRAQFVHVVAEAMKLAFADRAHWLGDPDFARVPRGLVDKSYAATLAERINSTRVVPVSGHGQPPRAGGDSFGGHTTHIAVADGQGRWVAITATVNTAFGSKVIIPGTGVLLNNQMDDFSIQPGVPNAFGLIGAEANAVAAGKRPLSSMSPTIVLRDGQPILTVGAAGGPTIISQVVLAIVRRVDLGMTLDKALAAPRFHHQWVPDRLRMEHGFPKHVLGQLQQLGHNLQPAQQLGVTQAIGVHGDGPLLHAVSDPRAPGKAAEIDLNLPGNRPPR